VINKSLIAIFTMKKFTVLRMGRLLKTTAVTRMLPITEIRIMKKYGTTLATLMVVESSSKQELSTRSATLVEQLVLGKSSL